MTWPKFNCAGLGLSLGATFASTNDRPSYFSITFRFFSTGGEKKIGRLLHNPFGRTPTHVCRTFHAKYQRLDLPVVSIKHNLAKNRILH